MACVNDMSDNHVMAHPTRKFRDVFSSIGQKHIPSNVLRSFFTVSTTLWRSIFRIDHAEKFVFEEFAGGRDGFRPRYWLFRSFCYIDYNASFVLASTGELDSARLAAQVLHGALAFRDEVINNTLEPELEKSKPLDMTSYRKLFSRVAVTRRIRNHFIQEDVDFDPQDYIVVFIHGLPYKLTCLQGEKIISYEELHTRILAIMEHAKTHTGPAEEAHGFFGLLTAFVNNKHGKIQASLGISHAATIDLINAALFTLSIDVESNPKTPDETLRAVNADNYLNRDHRRSMYLVVTGNGRAGVVVNPHTGVGGAVSAKFTEYLFKHAVKLRNDDIPTGESRPNDPPESVEPLPLGFSAQWEKTLIQSGDIIKKRLYPENEQTVFTVPDVGHRDFRAKKISSDAAFHCALNLAYFRTYSKIPNTANFISLRHFRHGDIWRYVSSTDEMSSFIRNPNRTSLLAAVDAHRRLIKEQKMAEDEFYHLGMMMLKLVSEFRLPFISVPLLILIMRICIRDFAHRFLWLDIWASQIPVRPGLEVAGRGSVFLPFIPRNAFAGHYMIYDDYVVICFLRSLKRSEDASISESFVTALNNCLQEVKGMAHAEESGTKLHPA